MARDGNGTCGAVSRVFEVVDEEGQYGGKPLIYYPPHIVAQQLK
jgi:hypothetical protein